MVHISRSVWEIFHPTIGIQVRCHPHAKLWGLRGEGIQVAYSKLTWPNPFISCLSWSSTRNNFRPIIQLANIDGTPFPYPTQHREGLTLVSLITPHGYSSLLVLFNACKKVQYTQCFLEIISKNITWLSNNQHPSITYGWRIPNFLTLYSHLQLLYLFPKVFKFLFYDVNFWLSSIF